MDLFVRKKLVAILSVVGGLILVTILILSYRHTSAVVEASAWVEHTQAVLLKANELALHAKDVQANGRIYLVTRDEKFFSAVSVNQQSAAEHIKTLRELVSDNSVQVKKVDSLQSFLERTKPDDFSGEDIQTKFVESKRLEDSFSLAIQKFREEEERLLAIRKADSLGTVRGFESFLAALIFTLVILIIVVLISVRRGETLKKKLTEHNKNLEKTLREISDYKYALDESAIVAITDYRGIIKHVNDNFCRISKYPREDLIGKDHRIINSGYHSKDFIRSIWQTIGRGEIWKGELRNRAKDGSIYWVNTSIVPFVDDQGKPYQYLAIRSDITDQKIADEIKSANMRLEIEVQEKKGELADILEMMKDAFIMVDNDFCYTYVNKKFGEMSQKDTRKIIGKNVWDEFPEAVGTPTYDSMTAALSEKRYISHMDHFAPLDVWYENHIYPTAKGLSILMRDVTPHMRAERKLAASERLYRTIASSIPDSVICLLDTDYRYFLIEGDMLEKIGYSKAQLLDQKAIDVLPGTQYSLTEPLFKRVFNGETFMVETTTGKYDFLSRYVPLRNEESQIYAAMIVSIEVTELKNAQRKIADLNAGLERKIAERTVQLQVANKELESFSYSVAHDLRAPLRGIGGYASILLEDYQDRLDEEGKRVLSEIGYNARKMGTLIDDLLTFSRLGRKELRKDVVDMENLIADVLRDFASQSADIKLNTLRPVFGDFALLKHVVTNLVSNALKYSSKRPDPVIHVSSSQKDQMVTYSVADNGVGFDMQYADQLFGVFQRLHSSEEFEGTGVGLAIVKRIINRHGGEVWVEAKVNKGATFYFSVPAIPTEETNTVS
ncbi:MAG TPA: PAS domain S-box protein [Cyclobacteriaceae bacterium]|nr:PAS domain S-box protein [Cyclobacteriaceae bacterium]